MLEPLSESLRRLLLELKLCSASDLRRCRRSVRRLARDLPTFDSVWLDALVQARCLTPYQAKILVSDRPMRIRIGPCVLVDRLGCGPLGETFLARPREGHELCAIKVIQGAEKLSGEATERLQSLVRTLKGITHPSLASAQAFDTADDRHVVVSRYVPGHHLAELLVRRGRFPASVVWDIGRQLAEGLGELERLGVAHGDIRAANVRMTTGGVVVLVDPGLRAAIEPVLSVPAGLSPDRCDGIAPELIGTGHAPNTATDIYALGCLLWQLLAGRPPFPAGDPLIKLAAHQTRTVDDVRKYAPETPAELAESLRRMTARNPAERPAHFSELLAQWGSPGRSTRRRLAAFRRRFDAPSEAEGSAATLSTPTRWLVAAIVLFAVSGVAVSLADRGARNLLLSWTATLGESIRARSSPRERPVTSLRPQPAESDKHSSEIDVDNSLERSLPSPDPQGVIRLSTGKPYRAADISVVGPLQLIGEVGAPAVILVRGTPLKLWAETVRLENVQIRLEKSGETAKPISALVLVTAQNLEVERCALVVADSGALAKSSRTSEPSRPIGPAAVAWKLLDPRDAHGGTGQIRHTAILGDGPGVHLASPVKKLDCLGTLKIGPGPFVQMAAVPASPRTEIRFQDSTARSAGALLRWMPPAEKAIKGRIQIDAADCVFDVAAGSALFEFVGESVPPTWMESLSLSGEGSLIPADATLAAMLHPSDGNRESLDGARMSLEGLLSGPYTFTGSIGDDPVASEIQTYEAPRRSSTPPGIRGTEVLRVTSPGG